MDKKFLKNIKEKLEKEKETLEQGLNKIASKDKNLKDDYDAKFEDFGNEIFDASAEAEEVSQYDTRLSLEANLEVRLREVKRALERIKKGTYGKCIKCGREIDRKRLEALPTATTCHREECRK